MPKAPLDEMVHRSELFPPTFGDMALGGGEFTVVSFSDFVVTVDVVFCVIELSSTAYTDTGITNIIQKQATIPNAIVLLIFLFNFPISVSFNICSYCNSWFICFFLWTNLMI